MFHWLPVFVYAVLIFYMSSLPTLIIPGADPLLYFDPEKLLLHFLEYLPLGFLLVRAVSKTSKLVMFNPFFLAVLIGSMYGFTDEVHQYFVPGRTASIIDVLADSVGIAAGAYVWTKNLKKI